MKELLLLCPEKVHFTFNGNMKMQIDVVAMGSPLGPASFSRYIYDRVGKGSFFRINNVLNTEKDMLMIRFPLLN